MSLRDTLPDAVADAVASVIRDMKAQWEGELEQLRCERRLLVAELRLAALGATEPAAATEPKTATTSKATTKPRARA